jgi:anti-sigma factor RsiW
MLPLRLNEKLGVKRVMTHQEIHERLPDYVLGVLTPLQATEVTQHLAGCARCRQTVHGQRAIGALVRESINSATRPDPAQLRQLMPPIPQKISRNGIAANWTTRLAPALLLLLVIVGSLLMTAPESKRPMSIFFAATATATSTNTPTATVAQDVSRFSDDALVIMVDSASKLSAPAVEPAVEIVAAPVPLQSPTPIAVISSTTTAK